VVSLGDAIEKKRAERRSEAMRAMVDEIPSAGDHDSVSTWEPALVSDHPQGAPHLPSYANGAATQRPRRRNE
jgi:hypothetical protein